jgi:hypothetical protein
MMAIIVANFTYVNGIHEYMHTELAKISQAPCKENEQIINNLISYWEKNKDLVSLSVSFREIEDLSNALDAVYAANNVGNGDQLSINLGLLKNSIDAIIRLEKISISNILKRITRRGELFFFFGLLFKEYEHYC